MKHNIKVIDRSHAYILAEWNEFVCAHEHVWIERACCPAGTMDCGCWGRDAILCENPECTGIEDWQVEDLWGRADG